MTTEGAVWTGLSGAAALMYHTEDDFLKTFRRSHDREEGVQAHSGMTKCCKCLQILSEGEGKTAQRLECQPFCGSADLGGGAKEWVLTLPHGGWEG